MTPQFDLGEAQKFFVFCNVPQQFDISSLDEWRTQAYENAGLFKENVKRWHDKRLQKREFNVGDYVLLFNSRLSFFAGKLLSKWEGPYVIEEVYRSSAIKSTTSRAQIRRW